MSQKLTEIEILIREGKIHEIYEDPNAHISESIKIYEKYAICEICQKKEMKVTNWLKHLAVCKNCGHKTKDPTDHRN